jgi:hypothetical protein
MCLADFFLNEIENVAGMYRILFVFLPMKNSHFYRRGIKYREMYKKMSCFLFKMLIDQTYFRRVTLAKRFDN